MATTRIWDKDNEYILAFKRSVAGNQSCLPLVKYMLSSLIGLATYPKKINMKNKILCGDSLEVLKDFEDNYFDSVVTDPPYGLAFMGKKWDYDVPKVDLWKEVYRVLKPGGHILSFAGSRTYHRMAVNIEDAGFEIRDMLGWLYGSGFPKSHNIGKALDKLQGSITPSLPTEPMKKKGEVGEISKNRRCSICKKALSSGNPCKCDRTYKPNTKEAKQWEGWGTALKPAHEPIVMARKPFNTTVAENVLTHGTGGINIDECRVGTETITQHGRKKKEGTGWKNHWHNEVEKGKSWEGRFPSNIIHDGSEEVLEIFPESKSQKNYNVKRKETQSVALSGKNYARTALEEGYNDKGSAARFFYCAKASKAERNMGLDDYEEKPMGMSNRAKHRSTLDDSHDIGLNRVINRKNYHPTVKPIKLMEYLVRLVTPKEGIVLEPFAGSGTTLIACKQQGFNYIGIEREQEYCDIAEARLKGVQIQGKLF